MSKFTTAFSAGQEKAKDAQHWREEIYHVMQQAKNEILSASEGKIVIEVANFPTVTALDSWIADIRKIGIKIDDSFMAGLEEYWIIALNPAIEVKWLRLAKWQQSPEGYPCTISFGGYQFRCHNKDGLEDAVISLFASTECAEKFNSLLRM